MAKSVKAKVVASYDWECPGCGESNIDPKLEREAIHKQCDMDYISVKCSNCNGSYIIEGSCGWLTKYRLEHGLPFSCLKQANATKRGQIKYTREQLTRYENDCAQCFMCGGYGKDSDAIVHDPRCVFIDPTVEHVYVGGKL